MKLTNEEKCTYCREYGNLPCDVCNKKLEAKKAMSKRLEELYESGKLVDTDFSQSFNSKEEGLKAINQFLNN